MKVGFQENDENSVRSLSISQHGNFPSPPAPVADLSSALTFPLKPQDPSLPFPLPETNNNNNIITNNIYNNEIHTNNGCQTTLGLTENSTRFYERS